MQLFRRRHQNTPSRGRAPARWTVWEAMLILVSALMIIFPLYAEIGQWIYPPSAPAQESEPIDATPVLLPSETEVAPISIQQRVTSISTDTPRAGTPTNTSVPTSGTATDTPTNTPTSSIPTATPTPPGPTNTAPPPVATNTPGGPLQLTINKFALVSQATPGEVVEFYITVKSNSSIDTVNVADTLDSNLDVQNASSDAGSCNVSGQNVSCSFPTIANVTVNITIRARLKTTVPNGTLISNSATVSGGSVSQSSGFVTILVNRSLDTPTPGATTATPTSTATTPSGGTPTVTTPSGGTPTATSYPSPTTATVPPTKVPTTPPNTAIPTGIVPTAQPTAQPTGTPIPGGGSSSGRSGGGSSSKSEKPSSQGNRSSLTPPVPPPPPPTENPFAPQTQPTTVPPQGPTQGEPQIVSPIEEEVEQGEVFEPVVEPTHIVEATPEPTVEPTKKPTPQPTPSEDGISLRMMSNWGSAEPGQDVEYTLVLHNDRLATDDNANTLNNIVIQSTLPANLIVQSVTTDRGSDPIRKGNEIQYKLDTLRAGEAAEVKIQTMIKEQVEVGTLLVAQGRAQFNGLSRPFLSNIVTLEVVGATQRVAAAITSYPPPDTATPIDTSTPASQSTSDPATDTPLPTGDQPTATSTSSVAIVAVAPTPKPQRNTVRISPQGTIVPLPATSTGIPLAGFGLLGITMFVRTIRLHRARERI